MRTSSNQNQVKSQKGSKKSSACTNLREKRAEKPKQNLNPNAKLNPIESHKQKPENETMKDEQKLKENAKKIEKLKPKNRKREQEGNDMEHVIKKICINSKNQSVTDTELNRPEEISGKTKLGTREGDTERRLKKVRPNIEIRDDLCGEVSGQMAVGIERRNINEEMENASMPCGAEITCREVGIFFYYL